MPGALATSQSNNVICDGGFGTCHISSKLQRNGRLKVLAPTSKKGWQISDIQAVCNQVLIKSLDNKGLDALPGLVLLYSHILVLREYLLLKL